jgi:Protein of unknown function (DUF2757)
MAYEYVCRYCHTLIGKIDHQEITEEQLGFDRLTPEEREDIITNDVYGNQQIRVVCETCQEVLESYPERSLLPCLFH